MSQDFDSENGSADGRFDAQAIAVDDVSLTAFLGPTPRGPVDHPVYICSVEEFDKQFGVPDYHCRMAFAVRQFFAGGGRHAAVVRVSANVGHNRIVLHGDSGPLLLEARNPGALEFLRASVDYDSIPTDETQRFNIVIQRLRSADSAWIAEQEYFRSVSTDLDSRDFIGKLLTQSELVRLAGRPPAERPELTIRPGSVKESGYVDAVVTEAGSPPPSDYDLVGSIESGTGLAALAKVSNIAHLCLISGTEDAAIGPVAMLAAERYCRANQALLIVDPPARWKTPDDAIEDQRRSGFSSPNALTWFPCTQLRDAAGQWHLASATGAVAAALGEVERTRGMQRLHDDSVTTLRSGLRVVCDVQPEDIQRLLRDGVNTLARRSALHLQVHGNVTVARHAHPDAGSDDLDLRIQILSLARRIRLGTRWAAMRPSDPTVWRQVCAQLEDFLRQLEARQVLAGSEMEQAWFIKCDRDTQKTDAAEKGTGFLVGVALRKPGEFFVLRFHQSESGCTVGESGWLTDIAEAI
jgi:hypothetical protein